jgi:hypothetical protein
MEELLRGYEYHVFEEDDELVVTLEPRPLVFLRGSAIIFVAGLPLAVSLIVYLNWYIGAAALLLLAIGSALEDHLLRTAREEVRVGERTVSGLAITPRRPLNRKTTWTAQRQSVRRVLYQERRGWRPFQSIELEIEGADGRIKTRRAFELGSPDSSRRDAAEAIAKQLGVPCETLES